MKKEIKIALLVFLSFGFLCAVLSVLSAIYIKNTSPSCPINFRNFEYCGTILTVPSYLSGRYSAHEEALDKIDVYFKDNKSQIISGLKASEHSLASLPEGFEFGSPFFDEEYEKNIYIGESKGINKRSIVISVPSKRLECFITYYPDHPENSFDESSTEIIREKKLDDKIYATCSEFSP